MCRADEPCSSLAQCTSTANHCISYFFTLSKKPEDWLSTKTPEMDEKVDTSLTTTFSGKSSICGDEFEVLSWTCSSQTEAPLHPKESVREELRMWLKSTSPPLSDCEWLTDCCLESGCRSHFQSSGTKGIEEWLMKSV